jgi:membrane protein implicated in regulation of membrane protease activity
MPRSTTIAAGSGLVAGISLTAAAVDGVSDHHLARLLLATITVGFFPTVVVTLVALGAARRWSAAHEERTSQQLKELARYREEMGAEFDRRSRELSDREEQVNRHTALGQEQYRSVVEQLRVAREERAEAIRQRDQLQEDFEVLAGEYNGLVLGQMDERSAQFSKPRRPRGPGRERRRERLTSDTGPSRLYIGRQAQPEPEQHARPAEG